MKRLLWIISLLALAVLLVFAFQEQALVVDLATVQPGSLRVTVDDDGVTRVRERYTISAPVSARLVRTDARAGDVVVRGETVIARFVPSLGDPLDPRRRDSATARLSRAESAMGEADARIKQAAADLALARSELRRVESLVRRGIRSAEDLERRHRDEVAAKEGLRAAEFNAEMARFGRDLARATGLSTGALALSEKHQEAEIGKPRQLELRAPIDGVVLQVFEESQRALAAGTPILSLGELSSLEIVADFLSQDAVKVRAGMAVSVTGWGGGELSGRVRLVEPSGFTRISALGVEEQRVNIRIDPEGDRQAWSALGDGYRVELAIELWRAEEVLLVPMGALFGHADGFFRVWIVEAGHVAVRRVKIGRRTGLLAQVLEGLAPGDQVVDFPSSNVVEGRLVTGRVRAR